MSAVKSFIVSSAVLGMAITTAPANDVEVANMKAMRHPTLAGTADVAFDIGWENSWRNELNWDAAWVFVKYRSSESNVWRHAVLSTRAGDHQAPAGCRVEAASDGTGAFLRSDSVQTGAVAFADVKLRWDYAASGLAFRPGESIDVSVHAIEMVYVPEGAFYLGTGGNEDSSFTDGAWQAGTAPIPFLVDGEGALDLVSLKGSLWAIGNIAAGELPAAFPKGHGAFYCMKHSITQGQYAEFLNELSPLMATNRYPGKSGVDRHTITHDAAWVFVKFRAPGSNDWEHAVLSTNPADHQAPAGCVVAPSADGRGVFVHGAGAYTGRVDYAGMRLTWDYGESSYDFAAGDAVDVAVFAIEVVYVAEGAFYLGSGGTESYSFTDGAWVSGAAIPFQVASENALAIAKTPGSLWATGNIGVAGELPAAYPKGYGAFYCMKYEISQGQYAAFLNTLTSAQAANRFANQFGNGRHTIRLDAGTGRYVAEAPDRACNFLSWADGAAYADWAGLRPMTELEYEKACRGFAAPVPLEFAWGTTGIKGQTSHEGVDGGGVETAIPADANVNLIYQNLLGPVRVGIYAVPGATRASSGAGYWGVMELSGNVWERVVTAGNAGGRAFTGLHGDGKIDAAGLADVSAWPPASGAGGGRRGISTHTNTGHVRTSSRYDATSYESTRHAFAGWRAARTAP